MTRPNQSGLTPELVRELLNKDLRVTEIARQFGVTVGYVSQLKAKIGYRTPKQEAMDKMPWKKLPREQQRNRIYQNLRLHLFYVAVGRNGVTASQVDHLLGFYNRVEDYVVEYDPEIPSTPNNKGGGFQYVPREERDGDLILRRNKHTRIEDGDLVYWRIPARLPK